MKYCLSLILLCFIVTGSFAQAEKNDLSKHNFYGPIKSYLEMIYSAKEKFGDPAKETKKETRTEAFNKAGYSTKYTVLSTAIKWDFSVTTKYDDNNKPVEQNSTGNGEVNVTTIKYDTNGKQLEVNVYDKTGKLINKQKNNLIDEPVTIAGKLYNKANRRHVYDGNGDLVQETISYDNIYSKTKDIEMGTTEIESNLLDKQENIVVQLIVKNDRDSTVYWYEYDLKNRVTEKRYWYSGKQNVTVTTYLYDTYGNVTSEIDTNGRTNTYSYTYDDQHNWTTMVKKEVGYGKTVLEITERVFKYY